MSIKPFSPVTRKRAAQRLSVSVSTIDTMIESGDLPPPRSIGRRRLYWHPEVFYGWLDKLLREQETSPTSPDTTPPTQAPEASTTTGLPSMTGTGAVKSSGKSLQRSDLERSRTRDARLLAELNR